MGTLYDYLAWRGDLEFSQAPINEVDSLIFSLISYIDFQNIVPKEPDGEPIPLRSAVNAFFAKHTSHNISLGVIVPKEIVPFVRLLKDTKRFRNVGMLGYVNDIDTKTEKQFSAITFRFLPDSYCVAYRGTDDTIVGWKENFNMSFLPVVPAQTEALQYLEKIAEKTEGKLYLSGHSKGGNLSVYAGVKAPQSVYDRIEKIWSNDGPGFRIEFIEGEEYQIAKQKIKVLVPQSSVVGMLLGHDEGYSVVKSRQVGLRQHDALSWEVQGSSFKHLKNVTGECVRTDQSVQEWMDSMTPEQKEQFSNALYEILSSDDALTLTDLVSPKNRWLIRSMKLDPQISKIVNKTILELVKINTKNLFSNLFPKAPKKNTLDDDFNNL